MCRPSLGLPPCSGAVCDMSGCVWRVSPPPTGKVEGLELDAIVLISCQSQMNASVLHQCNIRYSELEATEPTIYTYLPSMARINDYIEKNYDYLLLLLF